MTISSGVGRKARQKQANEFVGIGANCDPAIGFVFSGRNCVVDHAGIHGQKTPHKTGPQNARVWTITANNPGPGTAYTVQINGFNLKPYVPWEPCKPVVIAPSSFPVALGDLAEASSVSVSLTINFGPASGPDALFVLEVPWSARLAGQASSESCVTMCTSTAGDSRKKR